MVIKSTIMRCARKVTCMEEKRGACTVLGKIPEGMGLLGSSSVDGTIILKRILDRLERCGLD